jgi:hypothetical protein
MSSRYTIEYRRQFAFDVPPRIVWAASLEFSSWRNSSTWVHNLEVHGRGLNDGTVLSATVATPVAHPMHVMLELERCLPFELIAATLSGDFRGKGRLLLQDDNAATRAQVAWAVEMMPRSLRAVARVAGPLLRWGHDVLAKNTIDAVRARVYQLPTGTCCETLDDG